MPISQAIKLKAEKLALGAGSVQELSGQIAQFVQDFPYYLDEWDVGAEEVLRKKQGMCAGKALLAAELHRAVGIPARFKIIKLLGEEGLFEFVARRLEEKLCSKPFPKELEKAVYSIHSLPPQRDHIILQVFVDGKWIDLDLARDRELDYGMRLIGIWREREVLFEEGPYDSIDGWLGDRKQRRAVIKGRETFFKVINHQINKVRQIGQIGEKAGIQAWTDAEVRRSLKEWDIISGFPTCGMRSGEHFNEIAEGSKAALSRLADSVRRAKLEGKLLDWLYALARHNIKRGRFWELANVLTQHWADCLGYARLLSFLATECGIGAGVVGVVQDNGGRYVPHYTCLANLADGQRRLIDPWYGSADISHRLMVAMVKERGRLVLKQLTMPELKSAPEVYGLSPEQLAGLSLYILGNSYLARGVEKEAAECYDASLWLYPANPRTLFNLAIALDRIHEEKKAQASYQQAFFIGSSLAQILAAAGEIESLIELDEKNLSDPDQQVYLLRKGFVTGREEGWAEIAARCGVTSAEVQAKFNSVLTKLSGKKSRVDGAHCSQL